AGSAATGAVCPPGVARAPPRAGGGWGGRGPACSPPCAPACWSPRMRCPADPRPRQTRRKGPRTAFAGGVAALVAGCLLAACTTSPANHGGKAGATAGGHALPLPARHAFPRPVLVPGAIVGGPGGPIAGSRPATF